MKALLFALIAIGAIAYGADKVLHDMRGFSTAERSSASSVRLGN